MNHKTYILRMMIELEEINESSQFRAKDQIIIESLLMLRIVRVIYFIKLTQSLIFLKLLRISLLQAKVITRNRY